MKVKNNKIYPETLEEKITLELYQLRPPLPDETAEQRVKAVMHSVKVITDAMKTQVPTRVDIKAKYEVPSEDSGIDVMIDESKLNATGDHLVQLATFASDKGFNEAVDLMNARIGRKIEVKNG